MDTEPSTQATPSTTTAGPIVCENKQQEPTVAEKCRTSAGVYMGFDKDGNLVFASNLGEALTGGNVGAISEERTKAFGGKVVVYSVVQKSLEEKKKDIQYGMFVGYDAGLNDGLSGRPSKPTSGRDALGEAFNAGYKLGYPDGYAAGVHISIIHSHRESLMYIPPVRNHLHIDVAALELIKDHASCH